MIKFWSHSEFFARKGLLEWLHTCIDENIKNKPYDFFYYSDGSSSWCYKSKNDKWEISSYMQRVTFRLDEEYESLYELRWK